MKRLSDIPSTEKPKTSNLTTTTFSGLKWKTYATLFEMGSKLIVNIVLARLLGPRDFGLIAIAQIFIGIGTVIINTGVGPAIIQKQDLGQKHIRSGFALSTTLGLVLMVIIWFTAPVIAGYFETPDATWIIRLISLTLALDSFIAVPVSVIRKELNYRELFFFTSGSFLLGYALVSILFSVLGWGVYALVAGVLCRSSIGVMIGCRLYLKRGLPLRIQFFKKETLEIFSFGVWTTLSNLVGYASRNIDYFIVGKWLNAYSLGIYTKAFQFMQMGTANLTDIVSNVLFPSLSQIQDQKDKIRRTILGIVPILSIILFAIVIFLFVNAENVILGLLGEKWVDAVRPLQILCLAGYFRGIYKIADSVLLSLGKVSGQFVIHLVYVCLLFSSAIIGVKWGIDGVAYAVGLSIMAVCFMLYVYVSVLCSIELLDWLKSIFSVFVFSIVYGLLLVLFHRLIGINHYLTMFFCNVVFAVSVSLGLFLLMPFRMLTPDTLWVIEKMNPFLPKWPKSIISAKLRAFPHDSI